MPSQAFKLKPRIIQAGAGTGKTTRLTQEVFHVLERFKDQHERYPSLIICTFTRKATQELKRKLYQEAIKREDGKLLAHISSPSIHISTIHGILSLFLKNHGYKYDCDFSNFESNNLAKEEYMANRLAADLLFGTYFPLLEKAPFPVLQKALKFYTKCKLMSPKIRLFSEADLKEMEEADEVFLKDEKNNSHPEQKKLSDFFKECQKEPECFQSELFAGFFQDFKSPADKFSEEFLRQKKQNGVITMEDLELWSLDLLNRNPETGRLFSEDWDYWFIDEYQDTSWVQERIFHKITGFKNVFCVGDPQQSIYLFREADPEVFERRVKSCQGSEEKLKVNYRSQSPLIYFFNDFFPKDKGFIPLIPSKMEDTSTDKKTPSVYFIYYDVNSSLKEEEENIHFKEAVYFQIQRLLKKGSPAKDITVLGMKNEHLSQLARFLRQKGLSVRIHSSKGLSENRMILDALFILKFLINPHDDENFLALCRTPYFRISDEQLTEWCQVWDLSQKPLSYERHKKQYPSEKNISDKETSKTMPSGFSEKDDIKENSKASVPKPPLSLWNFLQKQQAHQEVIQTLKNFLNLTKERGILSTFEHVLFKSGLMDLTEFQDPSGVSESYLWNLLAQMRDTQKTLKNPLELFYSLMEGTENDFSVQDSLPTEDSDCIQLMTVHSSKGLQFKNVIVFDLTKSIHFNAPKEECIFDREKGLMAFSIPLKGREQKSVKCYAHKKYADNKKDQEMEEKDRLLYVALTRAEETVTLMVPAKKPSANSWFERFNFFRELENIPLKKKSKKPLSEKPLKSSTEADKREVISSDQTDFVKTGLHIKKNYCFLVEHNPVEKELYQNNIPSPPLLKPFHSIKTKPLFQKTAGDFVQDKSPSSRKNGFVFTREKNIFLKTDQGRYLHDCLRLLSIHSLDVLKQRISQRNFSDEEKNDILSALRWINNLEEPNMKHFLKTGFAEWPFQRKTNAVILQGRIDLWGWKDDALWVFDYKSATKASPSVFHQLSFYSYVLERIYKPKQIKMCGLYPFAKKTNCITYSEEHKQQISHWIEFQNREAQKPGEVYF